MYALICVHDFDVEAGKGVLTTAYILSSGFIFHRRSIRFYINL